MAELTDQDGAGATQDLVTMRKPAPRVLPLGLVEVTAHGLRIRRTPDASVDDNIVGELHYHAVITAVAHEGEWLRIVHRGELAYIHGDYVQALPPSHGVRCPDKG